MLEEFSPKQALIDKWYDIVTFHEQLHGSDIYLLSKLHKNVYSYYSNYKNDVLLILSSLTYFPTWNLG